MPPVGFEPTISAGERPQIHALDRAAIVISLVNKIVIWTHSMKNRFDKP